MASTGAIDVETLKLQMGAIQGLQGIKNASAFVKRDWTAKMVANVMHQFPKTRIPYRTGTMYFTWLAALRSSLQKPGTLVLGCPGVGYAGYVNAMPPWFGRNGAYKAHVTWTGGGNRGHWFENVQKYVDKKTDPQLRESISASGLDKITGIPVRTLVGMIAP